MAEPKAPKGKQVPPKQFKPGTPELERFISIGYPDIGTREHAQEIIKGYEAKDTRIPWEQYQRAKAYLAAIDAKPEVIDVDNPGVRNTRPR